jgi:hypothetical protein
MKNIKRLMSVLFIIGLMGLVAGDYGYISTVWYRCTEAGILLAITLGSFVYAKEHPKEKYIAWVSGALAIVATIAFLFNFNIGFLSPV